jgi:uncharacterized membrane protein (DUF373 family)
VQQTAAAPRRDDHWTDRVLEWAEDAVYLGIAALLLISSGALVVVAIDQLLEIFEELTSDAILEVLDTLLLVFILVELLSAVRRTLAQRQLVAEPFLIVGIIASIKEIVVVSLKASEVHGDEFTDAMTEIGVLAGVVLLLGVTSFLVRRKEREPEER